MSDVDFQGLAQRLLSDSRNLVPSWLHGGKLKGAEYCCGSLRGGPGDSCRVNVNTGAWADFAADDKGGDLISLYAAIQGIKQIEAAKILSENSGYPITRDESSPPPPPKPPEERPSIPPGNVPPPTMKHFKLGMPAAYWIYRSSAGRPVFYVARYDTDEGKQMLPWSWFGQTWKMKGWPAPRPLYNLDKLKQNPLAPVLIVEGEKAADAAHIIAGNTYVVVTWPNGSKAVSKTNWKPIYGRKVLLWPDADEPGRKAMLEISELLQGKCPEIKMLDVPDKDGWDAADALAEGWTYGSMKAWAKGIVKTLVAEPEKPKPAPNPEVQAVEAAVQKVAQGPTVNIFTEDLPELNGSLTAIHDQLGVPLMKSGQPICNLASLVRALEGIESLNDFVWFDEFHQKYFTKMGSKKPREWEKVDSVKLLDFFQHRLGMHKAGIDMVSQAILLYARRRVKNEPRDWFETLEWDGVNRLESFFQDCFGAVDDDYTRAAGANFWIGIIARIYKPGCKLDNMVVLEGAQGVGKSMALEVIGGKWSTVMSENINSKDFFMALHGKLIVEIAELDSFNRADITRIKQVITSRTDRYRAPYEDKPQDHPRQSIFVGTTNEHHWQRDHTGARRFWPIACKGVHLALIKANRKQYFAEAIARFKKGEDWYKMPVDKTLEVQEERRQHDEWEQIIEAFLTGAGGGMPYADVTITEIAQDCLKMDFGRLDVHVQRRIANVLRTIGWEKSYGKRGNKHIRVWKPTEEKENEHFQGLLKEIVADEREPGQEG